jgi:hypothetical protein
MPKDILLNGANLRRVNSANEVQSRILAREQKKKMIVGF